MAAGPSKAEGIAPHVDAETPWPPISGFDSFARAEAKQKFAFSRPSCTLSPCESRREEGQEQDTSQHR